MTTETKINIAASAKADGFSYVRSADVAVVSVSCGRSGPQESLRSALQACVVRFQVFLSAWLHALPGSRILLFAATPLSRQHNVISRHRGVWGADDVRWLPASAPRSASVEIREAGETRFVGLAAIPEENFFEAADYVRTHDSFILVSSIHASTEEDVRAIAKKILQRGRSDLDWANIIAFTDAGESICIRASGGFDDPEAAIDAFLHNDLRRKLEAAG